MVLLKGDAFHRWIHTEIPTCQAVYKYLYDVPRPRLARERQYDPMISGIAGRHARSCLTVLGSSFDENAAYRDTAMEERNRAQVDSLSGDQILATIHG